MALKGKLPKISKVPSRRNTGAKNARSKKSIQTSSSEKRKGTKPRQLAVAIIKPPSEGRRPLIEPPVQRAELINIDTTNSNIVQQLKMLARFPFGIPEDSRDEAVKVASRCMGEDSVMVRLAGANLLAKLMSVNVSVVRTIATDQVQRHVSFDKKDEVLASKFSALEDMTDEELDALESLSRKAGGVLPIKDAS